MLLSRHTVYTYKEKTTKKRRRSIDQASSEDDARCAHDGAGRCDECRAAIGTGERDETREFTREVRVHVVRCCVCAQRLTVRMRTRDRERRPAIPDDEMDA